MLREFQHELLEILVAGHEIGLTVDLDQTSGFAVRADERPDQSIGRLAVGFLGGFDDAALAQQRNGFVLVAARVLQGFLHVHHASGCHLAEFLD